MWAWSANPRATCVTGARRRSVQGISACLGWVRSPRTRGVPIHILARDSFSLKQIGHSTFLPRCRLKPSSITTSMHRRTSTMHMIWAPGSSSLERSPTWRHEAARRHLGVVDPLGACVAHGSSCCQDEAHCFALMRPRTHCLLPFDHDQLLDSAQSPRWF